MLCALLTSKKSSPNSSSSLLHIHTSIWPSNLKVLVHGQYALFCILSFSCHQATCSHFGNTTPQCNILLAISGPKGVHTRGVPCTVHVNQNWLQITVQCLLFPTAFLDGSTQWNARGLDWREALFIKVSSFQGVNNTYLYEVWTWSSVLIREVSWLGRFPHFRVVL